MPMPSPFPTPFQKGLRVRVVAGCQYSDLVGTITGHPRFARIHSDYGYMAEVPVLLDDGHRMWFYVTWLELLAVDSLAAIVVRS